MLRHILGTSGCDNLRSHTTCSMTSRCVQKVWIGCSTNHALHVWDLIILVMIIAIIYDFRYRPKSMIACSSILHAQQFSKSMIWALWQILITSNIWSCQFWQTCHLHLLMKWVFRICVWRHWHDWFAKSSIEVIGIFEFQMFQIYVSSIKCLAQRFGSQLFVEKG